MYAVVKTGGKQYRVAENDVIRVERLNGDVGSELSLEDVLLVGDGAEVKVGKPYVDGASVRATVLEQAKGDKIVIFKKKRRKNHRKKQGHRQFVTVLRITSIAA